MACAIVLSSIFYVCTRTSSTASHPLIPSHAPTPTYPTGTSTHTPRPAPMTFSYGGQNICYRATHHNQLCTPTLHHSSPLQNLPTHIHSPHNHTHVGWYTQHMCCAFEVGRWAHDITPGERECFKIEPLRCNVMQD